MKDSAVKMEHMPSVRVSVRNAKGGIAWEDGGYCPICFDYISCGEIPVLVMVDTPTRERPHQSWALAHSLCADNGGFCQ